MILLVKLELNVRQLTDVKITFSSTQHSDSHSVIKRIGKNRLTDANPTFRYLNKTCYTS